MRDEAEILDELHGLDRYPSHPDRSQHTSTFICTCANLYTCSELRSFPSEAHWFCPRRHDGDDIDYDNSDEAEQDMSLETKQELIQDAKRRHAVAYKYSLILGMAQDIAGQLLTDYTGRLNLLFTQCDKCIRNWHSGRKPYLRELAE